MKIKKEDFLIQVKYADLTGKRDDVGKFFFGFGGELYLSAEEIKNRNPAIIGNIKSFVKNNGLPLRLHCPIAEIDYSQIQDTISRMMPLYQETIRLCKTLDINCVVTHADFPAEKEFENAVSLWRTLSAELVASGIDVNIENHCEAEPRRLISLMERISSPHLGMCVDIGHFNAFSDLSIREWLGMYPAGSIKEVHLADNEGDDDTHLPLGDGNIDFADFFDIFAKRGEDSVFVLEPKNIGDTRKSLSFLRKAGFIG